MIYLEFMQFERKTLIDLVKAYENSSTKFIRSSNRRSIAATSERIAALNIEIIDLESRIIVAGGMLLRFD